MFERTSGVLMHITSLPSPYGIGTMGADARAFVDFLRDAGQRYWQVLPLGRTGFGASPYQCFRRRLETRCSLTWIPWWKMGC